MTDRTCATACLLLRYPQLNIFDEPQYVVNGPPKLVVWDMKNHRANRTFVFPHDVAPYDGSFLNDIVVDDVRGMAYISSTWGDGAMIVYDYNANMARSWTHVSMNSPGNTLTIAGFSYPVKGPMDSIALAPHGETVYYAPLDGFKMHSIDASYLRDFSLSSDTLGEHVVHNGEKGDASDGFTVSSNGTLYYGGLQNAAVYRWNPWEPLPLKPILLTQDDNDLQWVDTFAWSGKGHLVFTSNRLQRLFFGSTVVPPGTYNMNASATDANFRISRICIGELSYIDGEQFSLDNPSEVYSAGVVITLGVVVMVMAVTVLTLGFLLYRANKAKKSALQAGWRQVPGH